MKRALFLLALIAGLVNASFGQDTNTDNHTLTVVIPEVALVDVEPAASKNITLTYTAPTEAGLSLTGANNSSLWLNYSSIKTATIPTRVVSVKLDQVIGGVNLKVTASADAGNGDGTVGTPAGSALTLTTGDQQLITGIGSCYTGDGASSGHNLTYEVDLTGTYADLQANSPGTALTVTYTISTN